MTTKSRFLQAGLCVAFVLGAACDDDDSDDMSSDDASAMSEGGGDGEAGGDGTTPGGGMLLDGEECMENGDCMSGKCLDGGLLRKRCGDCLTDDECEVGCRHQNGLAVPPIGSRCEDGTLGKGCQGANGCAEGFQCVPLLVFGSYTAQHCSECATDDDCSGGTICSPVYDVPAVGGHFECVEPGSLSDGASCDAQGNGDDACENFCTEALVLGAVPLGICGPCITDLETEEVMGCEEGETCVPPLVDLVGAAMGSPPLVASACEAAE